MCSTRVSTLSINDTTINYMNQTMSDLARIQKQISSGQRVDSYVDLSGDGGVERVIDYLGKQTRIEDYLVNNRVTANRLKQMDISLEQIIGIAANMKDSLALRRSSAGRAINLDQIAASALQGIRQNLNVNFEGRYLFSGSLTDQVPVGDIVNNSNYVNKTPTANYYSGDDVIISLNISEISTLMYGVKANDEAFQKLIAGIHVAIDGDELNDAELLDKAAALVETGLKQIIQLRSNIGNNLGTLDTINEGHEKNKVYFNEVLNGELETNIPEAVIKSSNQQLILQSIFQTFARVSNLTLTKYL